MPRVWNSGCWFEMEDLAGGRRRTVGAGGPLVKRRTTVGAKNAPLPPCYLKDSEMPGGRDRGHLIAEEFGGPNAPENIVPMLSSHNRRGGPWDQTEGQIKNNQRASQAARSRLISSLEFSQ